MVCLLLGLRNRNLESELLMHLFRKNELGIKIEMVALHYLGIIGNRPIPGTFNFAPNNISIFLKYHSLNKKYK